MEGLGGKRGVEATLDGVQERKHLFFAHEDGDVYGELDRAIGLWFWTCVNMSSLNKTMHSESRADRMGLTWKTRSPMT